MASFESVKLQYSSDNKGKPLYARVCWKKDFAHSAPKPIVIIGHAGGLMVGSADIIPAPQIAHLTSRNILVVIPNYRLSPQADAATSFADFDRAYDWTISTLPSLLQSSHDVEVDSIKVGAYGHSIGGTLALHLASRGSHSIRAVTALYPSLYISDEDTALVKPFTKPPFGLFPDYLATEQEWLSVSPADHEVSEAPLARPGVPPAPRNRWQMSVIKNGTWLQYVLPGGGSLAAVDPTRKFEQLGAAWPSTLFVSPELDDVPGSGPGLIELAVRELKVAGAKEVEVISVPGQTHMFDLPPMVGTSDLDYKWESVLKGLNFLVERL